MNGFQQWLAEKEMKLNEKGKRTALSANYPSLYHSQRQQPRQTWMPISATAALADKQIGPDEKVKDGGPNTTSKEKNPYKSFYQAEWQSFLNKKINEGTGAELWRPFFAALSAQDDETAVAHLKKVAKADPAGQEEFFDLANQHMGQEAVQGLHELMMKQGAEVRPPEPPAMPPMDMGDPAGDMGDPAGDMGSRSLASDNGMLMYRQRVGGTPLSQPNMMQRFMNRG